MMDIFRLEAGPDNLSSEVTGSVLNNNRLNLSLIVFIYYEVFISMVIEQEIFL